MLSPRQKVINLPWVYFPLSSVYAVKQSISKICEDWSWAEINIMLLALSMGHVWKTWQNSRLKCTLLKVFVFIVENP